MQDSLFPESELPQATAFVKAVDQDAPLFELAEHLPSTLRLGTSSWHYPGWVGLVWDKLYTETQLSSDGLSAYAKHPLFRTVGVDRGFYRPMTADQYAAYAGQVPEDFRFMIKAPSLVTDALIRPSEGKGRQVNADFLNSRLAKEQFVQPALRGLERKLGALVFQISPLPASWLGQMPRLIDQLHRLLRSIPELRLRAPEAVVAVEVRDPQWLTPEFVDVLRDTGATYCLGLHAKMPPISEQLPILRALWPGPLVCRWNLNPIHGAYGYESPRDLYSPFNKLVHPDKVTREALAKIIAGTTRAGELAYVTLSNKAEGSSPLSVVELAKAIVQR